MLRLAVIAVVALVAARTECQTFVNATVSVGLSVPPWTSYGGFGRGSAWADFDGDGDLDIWLPGEGVAGQLIRNEAATGNWIRFDLEGTTSNRDAIGAVVRVRCGASWRQRMVSCGEGFLSDADRRVHFGLGSAGIVDEVEIRWPSGSIEYRSNLAVNLTHLLVEARIVVASAPAPATVTTGTASSPDDVGRLAIHLLSQWNFSDSVLADGRIVRLSAADPLVQASAHPANGFFGPNVTSVSSAGTSSSMLTLPNLAWLSGLAFNWTVLTIDPFYANGIRSVVGPTPFVIQ